MRPGWQTSEFWLSIIAVLVSVLPQVSGLFPAGSPVVAAATAALTVAYTAGRSYVKAQEAAAAAPATLPPFGAMTASERAGSQATR